MGESRRAPEIPATPLPQLSWQGPFAPSHARFRAMSCIPALLSVLAPAGVCLMYPEASTLANGGEPPSAAVQADRLAGERHACAPAQRRRGFQRLYRSGAEGPAAPPVRQRGRWPGAYRLACGAMPYPLAVLRRQQRHFPTPPLPHRRDHQQADQQHAGGHEAQADGARHEDRQLAARQQQRARRKFSSTIGPSTKPSSSGAGSKRSRISA